MQPKAAKITFQKATQYFNQYKEPLETKLMQQLQNAHGSACTLAMYYQKDKQLFDKIFQQLTQGIES